VGCYAWSPDKVGRDAGELCGIDALGLAATDDIGALLALKPDCVVYNPMFADVDDLVRILSAGINVVTTSEFITGHPLGAGRDRIVEACGGISDRVDRVSIVESFDTTIYNSPGWQAGGAWHHHLHHPPVAITSCRISSPAWRCRRISGL
jgi:hypothetical protein